MEPIPQYFSATLTGTSVYTTPAPSLVTLAVVLSMAVYWELKENRIPNWLTLIGMGLGLLIGYLRGTPAFWSSLGGLAIGFGFLFLFYVFGGVGGGDVKLMGAAGALLGVELIQSALVYTALLGGVLAIMMLIWRRDFWLRCARGVRRLAFWRKHTDVPAVQPTPITVPYGLAIAVGCLLAILIQGAS